MSHSDTTHRFIFDHSDIRGEVTTLESSFQEAYAHQSFPESLRPLFGEFLAGASLLSEILKFEGILTLQAKGDGDVALIMAETDHEGHIRGIIRMAETAAEGIDYSSKTLPDLLGKGNLVITIDPKKGERYQGIIALDGDTLSDCLSHYFDHSEQLPTFVSLHADDKNAAGLFLQCLPAQEVKDASEREDQWNTAKQLAATCSTEELFTVEHSVLLYRLFHEMNCRIFEPKSIAFRCSCSFERSSQALSSIGKDEAYQLLQERDLINIDCQFCGKSYSFGEKELGEIFSKSTTFH